MDSKVIIVLVVLVGLGGKGWAAEDCISKLTPCAGYLNTTGKPDKTCCDGLIGVIEKDAQCLCGLLKSDAVKQLGINMTQAMELPARCGKNATADQCKTTSTGGTSSGASPSATPTEGSSSNSSSKANGTSNAGSREAVFSIVPIIAGVLTHLVVGEFSASVQMA